MPLQKAEKRSITRAMTKDRTQLVAFRQVISRRQESLVKLNIVGIQYRIYIGAL